jgi:hypothetical protein
MNDFRPIKGDAGDWHRGDEPGVRVLTHDDQTEIERLLVGRKVTKVDDEHLVLDNGTVIKAIGHDGGCACSAGCYDLSVLNDADNVITRVEFDYKPAGDGDYPEPDPEDPDAPDDRWTGYYRVFVFAEDKRINLMQFDGSDGNGYYGTGFEILVREAVSA